jgi:hypothetical protein
MGTSSIVNEAICGERISGCRAVGQRDPEPVPLYWLYGPTKAINNVHEPCPHMRNIFRSNKVQFGQPFVALPDRALSLPGCRRSP